MSRYVERRIDPFMSVRTKKNIDSGNNNRSDNEIIPGAYIISRLGSRGPRSDNLWDPTEQHLDHVVNPSANNVHFQQSHAHNNDITVPRHCDGNVSRSSVDETFNNEDSTQLSRSTEISINQAAVFSKPSWPCLSARRTFCCAMFVSFLIATAIVGTIFFYNKGKTAASPLLRKCGINDQQTLLQLEFSPLLQCEYCGGQVFENSKEVSDLYYYLRESVLLRDTVNNNTMITSCDPDNIALLWAAQDLLTRDPNVNLASEPSQRTLTRFVLVYLYESLDGRAWNDATNWLTIESECNWFGITCNHEARVVSLSLPNNNLNGYLDKNIGLLSELSALDMGNNLISGSIPSALWSLPVLANLRLQFNQFTGTIPASSKAHNSVLKHLMLGANYNLGGTLPILPEWKQLVELDLDSTSLTGTIPSSVGVLTALKKLFISGTAISGTIPESIGSLTSLEFFEINGCKLSGTIPSTIGQLENLKVFDVAHNNLEGKIPSEIGQCSQLSNLLVSENILTGTVPMEVGTCEQLKHMDLSSNSLSGTLPLEFERLLNLEALKISCTAITSPIPVGLCKQRTKIQVSGNHQYEAACLCCESLSSQLERDGVQCFSP